MSFIKVAGVTINLHKPDNKEYWQSYKCGHCNKEVLGIIIAKGANSSWLLCPACLQGSVSVDHNMDILPEKGSVEIPDELGPVGTIIYPGSQPGAVIKGLPDKVDHAYQEAKKCYQVNAFTACELICRKILMCVAVDKGAEEGDYFTNYITHLEKAGYITPPMKKWVKLIKDNGNKATHQLAITSKKNAEETLMFTTLLLQLIFETEYITKKYTNPPKPPTK